MKKQKKPLEQELELSDYERWIKSSDRIRSILLWGFIVGNLVLFNGYTYSHVSYRLNRGDDKLIIEHEIQDIKSRLPVIGYVVELARPSIEIAYYQYKKK